MVLQGTNDMVKADVTHVNGNLFDARTHTCNPIGIFYFACHGQKESDHDRPLLRLLDNTIDVVISCTAN